MYDNERIAAELTAAGLNAKAIDGWVYVALPDGRLMYIGCEWGQSLETSFYESTPDWFTEA